MATINWLITKMCGRLLIGWIQKISQATVRDEIWFMTRVDVVAADGTVAIYFQQFYKMYGVYLSVNILIFPIIGVSEFHFCKLITPRPSKRSSWNLLCRDITWYTFLLWCSNSSCGDRESVIASQYGWCPIIDLLL